MKRAFLGLASLLALAAACVTESPEDEVDDAAGEATPRKGTYDGGGGDDCGATQCFDLTAEQDISFIAVELGECPGAEVSLELLGPDGSVVDIDPEPHGNGQSCEGVSPDALKFEGLQYENYRLCVTYDGVDSVPSLTITVKAGQSCEESVTEGSCTPCDSGEGGAGEGGAGMGGEGGCGASSGDGGMHPGSTTGSGGSTSTTTGSGGSTSTTTGSGGSTSTGVIYIPIDPERFGCGLPWLCDDPPR